MEKTHDKIKFTLFYVIQPYIQRYLYKRVSTQDCRCFSVYSYFMQSGEKLQLKVYDNILSYFFILAGLYLSKGNALVHYEQTNCN